MRIAHVITRLIVGGAQENTLLTCQDLLRDWHDDVLLITGPGLGPEGSLEDEARQRGIPLRVIPELRRAIHPLRDWQSYRALRRALREFSPDVVHTHSGKAGLLGRQAAHALAVPAIVHTIHGAPFHAYQGAPARAFFRHCETYAARRCHRLVSVADALTEQLVRAGVAPRAKFSTVYSGLEIEPLLAADELRSQVRNQLGYSPEHIVVGKVARLFHLKGHADLIATARELCPRWPRLRFLFVGDGLLRGELEQTIADAGLTDRFQFTGLVPPQRIPGMLAAADIVAHCSLREGLARVLPQALLVGRPVISYDIDGAREVVIPGETGYLVPPQNVRGVIGALEALVPDKPLRARLAAAGRQRCLPMFRHTETTAQLRAIYEQLLDTAQVGTERRV